MKYLQYCNFYEIDSQGVKHRKYLKKSFCFVSLKYYFEHKERENLFSRAVHVEKFTGRVCTEIVRMPQSLKLGRYDLVYTCFKYSQLHVIHLSPIQTSVRLTIYLSICNLLIYRKHNPHLTHSNYITFTLFNFYVIKFQK